MKNYNFRENRVILLGDTHGIFQTFQAIRKLPDNVDLIHLGDGGWGFGFQEHSLNMCHGEALKMDKLLKQKNIKLYHLRGNHDNPVCWEDKFASRYDNLIFVSTGDTGVFPNGKKALFVCGGISIDRCVRKENFSYWKEEVTENLDVIPVCDYIFSHDCPSNMNHSSGSLINTFGFYVDKDPVLITDCIIQREKIDRIVSKSKAKYIYYGHYHNNENDTFSEIAGRCVDVDELLEITIYE